jgi:hypothetical protein
VISKVADTATPIPSGTGNFTLFGQANSSAEAPSVSGRNVVFVGSNASTAQEGVYLSANGVLTRVADRNTATPGASGKLSNFGSAAVEGTTVVFHGSASVPTFVTGIYKSAPGGGVVRVSDTTDGGFSRPEIVGGATYVFFDGAGVGNEAIVTDAGGTLHSLVTNATPVPGSTGTFGIINSNVAAAPNGGVAFYGSGAAQTGIYLYLDGKVTKVADRGTPVSDAPRTLQGFSNVNIGYDGTSVAFAAADANAVPGLYRTRGDAIVTVATSNAVVAGYGALNFSDANGIVMSIDAGRVAFSNGRAIFAEVDGALQKVIAAGDVLLGKTVTGLQFGTNGLSGNELAFEATFSDRSSGIFLADLPAPAVPLPPAVGIGGAMAAGGLAWGKWGRRRVKR